MRRQLWVVAFLAVALAVAGCGGADTSDAPPEEAERTEGAEEVAPERSAGTTAETTRLEETYPPARSRPSTAAPSCRPMTKPR